jgi:hypothetical protein
MPLTHPIQMGFRVTEAQRAAIEARARERGLSVAAFLRQSALKTTKNAAPAERSPKSTAGTAPKHNEGRN